MCSFAVRFMIFIREKMLASINFAASSGGSWTERRPLVRMEKHSARAWAYTRPLSHAATALAHSSWHRSSSTKAEMRTEVSKNCFIPSVIQYPTLEFSRSSRSACRAATASQEAPLEATTSRPFFCTSGGALIGSSGVNSKWSPTDSIRNLAPPLSRNWSRRGLGKTIRPALSIVMVALMVLRYHSNGNIQTRRRLID